MHREGRVCGGEESLILAPLLGELSSVSETERLYGGNACPGSGCFRFRDPEVLPQMKQLLCPTSPSLLTQCHLSL